MRLEDFLLHFAIASEASFEKSFALTSLDSLKPVMVRADNPWWCLLKWGCLSTDTFWGSSIGYPPTDVGGPGTTPSEGKMGLRGSWSHRGASELVQYFPDHAEGWEVIKVQIRPILHHVVHGLCWRIRAWQAKYRKTMVPGGGKQVYHWLDPQLPQV